MQTAGVAALGNRVVSDINLSIVVDGTAVGLSGAGVNLNSADPVPVGFDSLTIGTTGLVRSVSDSATVVKRSNDSILNAGHIVGGTFGIFAEGNNTYVINSGTINGGTDAVSLFGHGSLLTNSGTISSAFGISISTRSDDILAVSRVGSSGTLENSRGDSVYLDRFGDASVANPGQIR